MPLLRTRPLAAAGLSVALLAGTAVAAGTAGAAGAVSPPEITRADVDAALPKLAAYVSDLQARTQVPGIAVAVVYDDQVVYEQGFGVRKKGTDDPVTPETVFQLASVSKPISSSIVAALVGDGVVGWNDPVSEHDPTFAVADGWISDHATIADLMSHRSSLPGWAGDHLEDLGADREEVLSHLRFLPLVPNGFRVAYNYTNFGYTAGAVAAARPTGLAWEDVAAERLYEPLGMTSTSSRYADYLARPNRATDHRFVGGQWVPGDLRDPQAQAPAGGVSSNVQDMSRWLRMQLGNGTFEGREIVDPEALGETHRPHAQIRPGATPEQPPGWYGLGWNVRWDEWGQLRINHSGGFNLGAATHVMLVPSQGLGIVTLTNGSPIGVPEAIDETFLDYVFHGEATRDWFALINPVMTEMMNGDAALMWDYSKPPADPTPAQPLETYTGTFANDMYGTAEVFVGEDGRLTLRMGPAGMTFPLDHYSHDVFVMTAPGENGGFRSGVFFGMWPDGRAGGFAVEYLAKKTDTGIFQRPLG